VRRRAALFLILTVVFTGVLLALPGWIHPRLERELSHTLGLPVRFHSMRMHARGADLVGLQIGDFLKADEVDAYISWHGLDLHPDRLVLKKPEFRLDADVLRTLQKERRPGRPREFPLVFEEGRLLLFGMADVAPLWGEWGADHSLVLEHPQGGKWRFAEGKLTVDAASLVALAGFVGRQVPLDPSLVLSAALAFQPPAQGELTLPWGRLTLSQEGEGYHVQSPALGPLTGVTVDVHPGTWSLEAQARLPGGPIEARAAWKPDGLRAEAWAARVQLGQVELTKVEGDLHGSRLHATFGDAVYRGLRVGSGTLDLVLAPQLEGELRLARPLSLEAAQEAGLAPRFGFLRGVKLVGVHISGSLASPRITPRF